MKTISGWARRALSIAAIGFFAVGCGGQMAGIKAQQELPADTRAVLEKIEVQEEEGAVSLRVVTSEKVTYSAYQQEDPLRLILELPRTKTGDYTRNIPINVGNVSFIKPVMTKRGDSLLEVFLRGPSIYDIDGQGKTVKLKISPSTEVEAEELGGSPAAIIEEAAAIPQETIEVRPLEEAAAEPERAPEPQLAAAAAEPAMAPEPAAAPPPEPVPEAPEAAFVTGLDVQRDPGGTLAIIKGDGRLNYEYFLVEGKSLVVDVFDVGNKIWPTVHKVEDDYVLQVRIGEHFQPDKKVRVVFDLKKLSDYVVSRGESRIAVAFGDPQEPAPETMTAAPLNVVEEVYFRPLEGKSRIEIKTSGAPEFKVVDSEDPLRLIVEVGNAKIDPKAQKSLDISKLNRAVSKITAFEYLRDETPVVRVVAQLRETVPFRVAAAGDTIAVDVNGLSSAVAEAAPMQPAYIESPPAAMAAMPAQAAPPPPAQEADPGVKIYHGKRLSLDFVDADVNDILRLIADVSGLNFVAGPEVKGRVTIRLADVPWDQALEIILKSNVPPLAQIQESENIVRVTTLSKIQEEEEAKRRAAEQKIKNLEAQKKLEPLVTRSFKISYAKIKDIEKVVREFTSERVQQDGLLTVDERTSTIIVRDLKANVEDIARTVEALDAPTPAVVVEARIVEILDTAAKELGVQWGAAFAADAAHGNALPFEFPNSIGIGGGAGGATESGNPFLVNLPAGSPTSGIGINFGHIANTLSLDLRLTAMENMNKVRILSTPRVLVVQNETAKINVGQELPIPATDAEGNRTVTWRDVGISLEVKPQVTNDRRVFMQIKVAKESRGVDVPTTEGTMFSIDSRKAETQVLIADGETAVIGGLAQERKSEGENDVPGLSKIPGLGWLFKSKLRDSRNEELMIFLTPKIVNVL